MGLWGPVCPELGPSNAQPRSAQAVLRVCVVKGLELTN